MKIVFDYPKISTLQSLTMHIYDKEKLLLRVDWSCQDFLSHNHGQPHWHMCSKLSIVEDATLPTQTFSDFTTTYSNYQQENKSEQLLDINRIHLYMAYYTNNQSSLDLCDKRTLTHWLEYTMRYMNEQLLALKKHNGE